MECAGCKAPVTRDDSFEIAGTVLCQKCLFSKAESQTTITGAQRDALKRLAKEELAGLLPRDALKDMLEQSLVAILRGRAEMDEEVGRCVNMVERMAGLAICREKLKVLAALREAFDDGLKGLEEETRQQSKRLAELV